MDQSDKFLDISIAHLGDGRVGAHPPGVWSPIAVVGSLVVPRRRKRHGVCAIAEAKEGKLSTDQPFLDYRCPLIAEGALNEDALQGDLRLGKIAANRHP